MTHNHHTATNHHIQAPSNTDSPALCDHQGRAITYLRLAVTDRCNLSCDYCRPKHTTTLAAIDSLLTFDEMERLLKILSRLGVRKVRFTGGEPLLRPGLLDLLARVRQIEGIYGIYLTTNGTLLRHFLPALRGIGISGINVSLDTLHRERFLKLTKRDDFESVWDAIQEAGKIGIRLKLNVVVQRGINDDEIPDFCELTRERAIQVRFIEPMPFDGISASPPSAFRSWEILAVARRAYPDLGERTADRHSTVAVYQIPGYRGTVGIVAGFSRAFCRSCNRLRVTADGMLKTCLYDQGALDLRSLLRSGAPDKRIVAAVRHSVWQRARNGFEAQRRSGASCQQSMAAIGG